MPSLPRKYSLLRIALAFFAFLLISTPVRNENNSTRDGNWWRTQEQICKYQYVVGFFDGTELGYDFSYWGIMDTNRNDPAVGKIQKSYNAYSAKFLTNVTSSQLVDGLNEFYSDYRNRRITVINGIWLVLNEIAGTRQTEMQKMIESWRKNAVPPSQ